MNNYEIFIAIAIMSIISYFTRALPFIFLGIKKNYLIIFYLLEDISPQ